MPQKIPCPTIPIVVNSWSDFNCQLSQIQRRYPNHLLLFRGQGELHSHIRSGRSRPNGKVPLDVDAGWHALASKILGRYPYEMEAEHAKAILQHYGLATHFVDLTTDASVAVWFASRQYVSHTSTYIGTSMRQYQQATYLPRQNETGYVAVLAIPNADQLVKSNRLFDLSRMPAGCLRPHRQRGWLLLDRPPTEPTPNSFWVATIAFDSNALETSYQTSDLFPSPNEDEVYAGLLSLPFVQLPTAYFDNSKEADEQWCFANRALAIPEYVNSFSDEIVDRKWEDLTVFEPHHIRCWKYWQYDLSSVYAGIDGNIRNTTKVTLSPEAWAVLRKSNDVTIRWPDLDSDGLFFTFAELDHDKVVEHSPPYHGVWLQRDAELILEVPMSADGEALSVSPGHAYFCKFGQIERQRLIGGCKCDCPESHDARVTSILRLSGCIENGSLILLPHPRMQSLGWFIVVTGTEGDELKPAIRSFRRVHKAVMARLRKDAQPSS